MFLVVQYSWSISGLGFLILESKSTTQQDTGPHMPTYLISLHLVMSPWDSILKQYPVNSYNIYSYINHYLKAHL